MQSTCFDGCQLWSLCLTFSNMVMHIAPIIAPSSKIACTQTISPLGPSSQTSWMNGFASSSFASCIFALPTAYRSHTWYSFLVLGGLCSVSSPGSLPQVGTHCVGFVSPSRVICSPFMQTTLPLLPPPAHVPLFPTPTTCPLVH
jgi:hypothetical protein